MLHKGGPFSTGIGSGNHDLRLCLPRMAAVRFVLFGFRSGRALRLDRSASKHSGGYGSADRSLIIRFALRRHRRGRPANPSETRMHDDSAVGILNGFGVYSC